jgi:hypothetical protein
MLIFEHRICPESLSVEVGYTLYIICKNGEGAKIFIQIKSNLKTAFYKYNFNKSNLKNCTTTKYVVLKNWKYIFQKGNFFSLKVILRAKSNPKMFLIDSRVWKLKK